MSLIEVKNLSFAYAKQPLIDGLSFTVEKGAFLTIAGPNGAGKSTLLKLISAQLAPIAGSISLHDKDINAYSAKKLARRIALVRQEFIPAFGFSVYETVMMARTTHFNMLGFETTTDRQIVEWALDVTETTHLAQRDLDQLSGGERQRVFIARALAQDTPILLLDEPTSFLDLRHQVAIYDLLKKLQLEKAITIVSICHDLNLSAQYSDKILLLGNNCQHYIASPKEIFQQNKIQQFFSVPGLTLTHNNVDLFIPTGRYSSFSD